jgi:hypothetical protein
MSKQKAIQSIGMLGNIVVAATMAYTIILILKQQPLTNAAKPAGK